MFTHLSYSLSSHTKNQAKQNLLVTPVWLIRISQLDWHSPTHSAKELKKNVQTLNLKYPHISLLWHLSTYRFVSAVQQILVWTISIVELHVRSTYNDIHEVLLCIVSILTEQRKILHTFKSHFFFSFWVLTVKMWSFSLLPSVSAGCRFVSWEGRRKLFKISQSKRPISQVYPESSKQRS